MFFDQTLFILSTGRIQIYNQIFRIHFPNYEAPNKMALQTCLDINYSSLKMQCNWLHHHIDGNHHCLGIKGKPILSYLIFSL